MTTYASAPGTRLGGRYRLEDRIAAGAGWDAWKAIDETLARAVTVFTFASGFPRIGDVVTAARAAGVAHMCLSPGSVRWSPTGEVKVVGLGIDAALAGIVADEPVRDDTEGLGRLLYAA